MCFDWYNELMKTLKRIPFTKEGLEEVKKELEDLKKSRPEAVLKLAEARGMGDLSENGLYTAAKARLRSMDSRIFQLTMQIKLADVVSAKNSEVVSLGNTVEIERNKLKKMLHLVGDYEADPLEGKISQHSPIGKALLGKRVGDEVKVLTPRETITYVITSIK